MSKEELCSKLFKLIYFDIKNKGLSIKELPKEYPLSLGTIYRIKDGYVSKRTIKKIRKGLEFKFLDKIDLSIL